MLKKIKICSGILLVAAAVLFIRDFLSRGIDSVGALQDYIRSFGLAAPLVLTAFQALQVVIPILPGYLGCAAGAIIFGTMTGFWCNYIGISAGSIIAYYLARRFGLKLVLNLVSHSQYEKWRLRLAKSRSFGLFLFMATLLPLFPDDLLCFFSGLIDMNSRKFIWIIILGKPWCILAYSILFGLIK